jgi:hypothetical protein
MPPLVVPPAGAFIRVLHVRARTPHDDQGRHSNRHTATSRLGANSVDAVAYCLSHEFFLLFSLAIAVSVTWLKPLGPWLLAGWLAILAVDLFLNLRSVLAPEFPEPSAALYPVAGWAGFGEYLAALVVSLRFCSVWSRRNTVQMPAVSRVEIGR